MNLFIHFISSTGSPQLTTEMLFYVSIANQEVSFCIIIDGACTCAILKTSLSALLVNFVISAIRIVVKWRESILKCIVFL